VPVHARGTSGSRRRQRDEDPAHTAGPGQQRHEAVAFSHEAAVQDADGVVDVVDERLEIVPGGAAGQGDRIAHVNRQHLEVVQVTQQVLHAFEPTHRSGQPEPAEAFGNLQRVSELLQSDPDPVKQAGREDEPRVEDRLLELARAPSQPGRGPAGAGPDGLRRGQAQGEVVRRRRQSLDVDRGACMAHVAARSGSLMAYVPAH